MTVNENAEWTTWDGQPISRTPPHGASIVVFRRMAKGVRYLFLHRSQEGPEYEGDWAWGPPAGARHPGEELDHCAARELEEETGLRLSLRRLKGAGDGEEWVGKGYSGGPEGRIVPHLTP